MWQNETVIKVFICIAIVLVLLADGLMEFADKIRRKLP